MVNVSTKGREAARATASAPSIAAVGGTRKKLFGLLVGGPLVALAFAPSQASAQVQPGCTSTLPAVYNPFTQIIGGVVGSTNAITSVIGTMNTAFVRGIFGLPFIGPPRSRTASVVKGGWTAGGGIEDVLTGNWLGKFEFRYADFGHYNHNFFVNTIDEADVTVHARTCTILAGIGYKFNGTGTLTAQ